MIILQRVMMLSVALVTGLTLRHVLQSAGSRRLTGAQWLAVQHTFYGGFAIVGGAAEIIVLLAAVVLTINARSELRAAVPVLVTAVAMVGCLLAYAFGNPPVNQRMGVWTPETTPAEWQAARDTWETPRAVSAVLSMIALVVLIWTATARRRKRS